MVSYAIGDVQGCGASLGRLLELLRARAGYDPGRDRLWLAGDLVNRGPRSLGVLRTARAAARNGRARTVLGNHDLHLLSVAFGVRAPGARDTLAEVLAAPDRGELVDWLLRQPLACADLLDAGGRRARFVMTHAGLLPEWTVQDALVFAAELSAALVARPEATLRAIRTPAAERWDPSLDGDVRLSTLAAAFTRLRVVRPDGRIPWGYKGTPEGAPDGAVPWFEAPGRRWAGDAAAPTVAIAGHWAALGFRRRDDLLALDTGCVWGGRLSAVRLDPDPARRELFQVDCADGGPAPTEAP